MRVLHIAPAVFGENGVVGGAERYALELAKHMSAEVPTLFAAFGDQPRTEQMGDLPVHVLGPASYVRGQRANPITASLLSEIRHADIIHCHQQHILASSCGVAGLPPHGPQGLRQRSGRRRLGRVRVHLNGSLVSRTPAHQ